MNKLGNFEGSLILFKRMIAFAFKVLPLLVSPLIEALHWGVRATFGRNPSQLGAFIPNQLFDIFPTFGGFNITSIPMRHTEG